MSSNELKGLAEDIAAIAKQPRPVAFMGSGRNMFSAGYAGSDGSKYQNGISGSGSFIYFDHNIMRANARRAYHDTPSARAIVERYSDIVVGVGIKIAPTPRHEILGISPEQAEAWGREVAARYDLWFGSKDCHRSRTLTGYQLQRLLETAQQRDGEYFARFYYSKDKQLQSPLQIESIDPNQINGDAITSTGGFSSTVDGIERNSEGVETFYHVWVRDEKNIPKVVKIPAKSKDGKRPFMLHGYMPEYAGQGRGYSRLAHALQEFQNITDFSLASIQKAIQQASITMFVKPSKEDDATNPLEDLLTNVGAGPSMIDGGSDPLTTGDDGLAAVDVGPLVEYCPVPEAKLAAPGVGVFNLKRGEELKAFANTAPGDSYEGFTGAFITHLAAANSMPVEVLLMKFSSNYSASRGALIMFWEIAKIWRVEMDVDFMTPVYETWISEEIAAGRLRAPGWSDPRLRAAWLAHDLVAAPVPNIDPAKLSKAHKEQVEMGATDLDRVAHETNGSDGSANRGKLSRQVEELVLVPWSKGQSPEPLEKEDED